jgi:hypothetical protein
MVSLSLAPGSTAFGDIRTTPPGRGYSLNIRYHLERRHNLHWSADPMVWRFNRERIMSEARPARRDGLRGNSAAAGQTPLPSAT